MASAALRKSSYLRQVLVRIQERALSSCIPSKCTSLTNKEAKRQTHLLFPSLSRFRYMSSSSEISSNEAKKSTDDRRHLLNRILYRSKQRGFLELDLILGKWTDENIEKLDDQQLKSLMDMLNIENRDLWKCLTGQEVIPQQLLENPVFMEIHEKVMGALKMHSSLETRAMPGEPWVQGWDDNRRLGGPQVGNQ